MERRSILDFRNPSHVCSQCGKHIEIMNNDFEFSMELHMQSHKPLDVISKEFDELSKVEFRTTKNEQDDCSNGKWLNYLCLDCNKKIEIINNDITFTLQLHAQNHKFNDSTSTAQDQLSTCSNNTGAKSAAQVQLSTCSNNSGAKSTAQGQLSSCSKNSGEKSNKMEVEEKPQSSQVRVIDWVLNALSPDLKCHRDFIFENCRGKASCNVCNIIIEPVFSVPEHLKTKLHEDNIIKFLKKALPASLHQVMEFVSFYNSSLSCNLCVCEIDFCSMNPHETIINIIAHNNEQTHLNRLANTRGPDKSHTLLNSLAQISPLIEENKQFIIFKMEPNFQCELCDKKIAYHKNENELLKNFTAHLNGASHSQWHKVISVFKSVKLLLTEEEIKRLIVFKNSIFCKLCECHVEVNYDQIISHIKERCKNIPVTPESNIPAPTSIKCSKTNNSEMSAENVSSLTIKQLELTDLNKLLSSLPDHLKNTTCLTVNDQGEIVCLVCLCSLPSTVYNLQTHLMGKRHKSNESIEALSILAVNNTLLSQTSDKESYIINNNYKLLVKTDPIIASSSQFIEKYTNNYYYTCILCTVLIEVSSDLDIFKHNCHSHLGSFEHLYNLEFRTYGINHQDESFCVKKLLKLLPSSVFDNMKYIKGFSVEKKILLCSLCDLKISAHINCLQEHFEGNFHVKEIKKFNNITPQENEIVFNVHENSFLNYVMKSDIHIKCAIKYLKQKDGYMFCKLCKCPIRRGNNKTLFRDILLSHVEENEHKIRNKMFDLLEMLNKFQNSDSIIKSNKIFLKIHNESVYCTLCSHTINSSTDEKRLQANLLSHLSGDIHLAKRENIMRESSSFPIKPEITNSSGFKILEDLFKELPANFQDDIAYIRCSSVEGYVMCTLCSSSFHLNLLKKHLEGEKHKITKTLHTLKNLNVTKDETDKKESIQNKPSLQKLLGNIDNKLSWPLKK